MAASCQSNATFFRMPSLPRLVSMLQRRRSELPQFLWQPSTPRIAERTGARLGHHLLPCSPTVLQHEDFPTCKVCSGLYPRAFSLHKIIRVYISITCPYSKLQSECSNEWSNQTVARCCGQCGFRGNLPGPI